MISAMPAVAVRRGRKKSKTFGRFNHPPPPSHHSSTSSLAARLRSQRLSNGQLAFRHRHPRRRFDSELDRQRRRFLIYTGTLFLISGLFLVFIGVGAAVPTAQTVGLLLIAVGALLCIIKVFCSEAHATEVPAVAAAATKIIVTGATPETPPEEFTELPVVTEATSPPPTAEEEEKPPKAQTCSPPNSVPETHVLIENDSGARY